ncbi:8997_t:CDS:1, partial [Gigaspora rosea]
QTMLDVNSTLCNHSKPNNAHIIEMLILCSYESNFARTNPEHCFFILSELSHSKIG